MFWNGTAPSEALISIDWKSIFKWLSQSDIFYIIFEWICYFMSIRWQKISTWPHNFLVIYFKELGRYIRLKTRLDASIAEEYLSEILSFESTSQSTRWTTRPEITNAGSSAFWRKLCTKYAYCTELYDLQGQVFIKLVVNGNLTSQ